MTHNRFLSGDFVGR